MMTDFENVKLIVQAVLPPGPHANIASLAKANSIACS